MPRFMHYFLYFAKKDSIIILPTSFIFIFALKFNIFNKIFGNDFIPKYSPTTLANIFLLIIFGGYFYVATTAFQVKYDLETTMELTFENDKIDYYPIIMQSINKSKPRECSNVELENGIIFELWYDELDTNLELNINVGQEVEIVGPKLIVQFIEVEIHKNKTPYEIEKI